MKADKNRTEGKALESFVALPNGRMPYIRFGSGERIFVMISGMSTTGIAGIGPAVAAEYASFAEEYTVYLFDRIDPLPIGYTTADMAQDIAAAMRALNLADADVMGLSQGGMIAQLLAAEHPRLVHALSLCSGWCCGNEVGNETFTRWIELAEAKDGVGIYRDFFARVYSKPDTQLLKQIENTATEEQCRRFGILAKACLEFDSTAELPKIACPVQVIGVEDDRVLGAEGSRELARRLNCDLYLYKDFGHAVCDEAPDFTERLLAFFRQTR